MKHLSPRKLAALFALATTAVAIPAMANGVSLRRGGEAVGSETRNFAFANEIGLGLMRLSFVFQSGDNQLSRFGHMVGVGASHNWFSADAAATYDYDVKHYPLAGRVYTAHELECEGVCGLGIGPVPADHMLVLTGFVFEATDGESRQIRTVAIEPDPDNGIIWVELASGDTFDYGVTVQYSYVPIEDVAGGIMRSGTKFSNNQWRVQFKWPDLAGTTSPLLLHGFRLHFEDEAHDLSRLQLLLNADSATMYFTDADNNKPFTGTIDAVATTY